ncbi:MAG: cell division protein FtsZ [Pseudomonadota bacterium]
MTINLQKPEVTELKPRITVFGVGGGGGNAVNNMINAGLEGVDFVVANTDAQALSSTKAERVIQMGVEVTEGLGAGSEPAVGRAAAEECLSEITDHMAGTHMCFVTAGMGGGTGTGAAAVVAQAARELGILTVGVVTKPFDFEGKRRMKTALDGIAELEQHVDTLIVIPNQNLFHIANDKTGFADAFAMADQVLYSGVACITDLMVKEGLINLDFADVRSVMRGMGNAMMGTGEASSENRARLAAEAAISNPLLDSSSMKGARGLLISITGGADLTLFEVDEAASRIREEVDEDANIILGATFDENLDGVIRVSVVATGVERNAAGKPAATIQAAAAPAAPIAAAPKVAPRAQVQARQKIEQELALPSGNAAQPAPAPKRAASDPAVTIKPMRPAAPVAASIDSDLEAGFRAAFENETPVPSQPAPIGQMQAPSASPRMPRVEEFPPVAQAEMAAHRSTEDAPHDERSAMGLLKRLTNGLVGEKAALTGGVVTADQVAHQPAAPQPVQHAAPAPGVVPGAEAYAPQARRQEAPITDHFQPQQASLDTHGRVEQRPMSDEDQLEIPAFLRRQAN